MKLAPEETINKFQALMPEESRKRKIVLQFHPTMPEENQTYAFTKDSTWGAEGVWAACGNVQDLETNNPVKKVDVYVTTEKLVQVLGREEAVKQINNVIRTCLTQALASGLLSPEAYRTLSQKVYQELGSSPLIELDL